jgi:hypothetical protein
MRVYQERKEQDKSSTLQLELQVIAVVVGLNNPT